MVRGLWSVVCGLLLCAFSSPAAADDVPFKEPFDELSSGVLHNQNQWQAQQVNNAQVQTATVFAGSKATAVTTNTLVWHNFTNATATNVWIDFYARVPYPANADPPSLTGSVAAAFFVTPEGKVKAVSNDTWVTFDNWTVPSNTWQRFTLHLDYGASNWALYAAGTVPNSLSTALATNLAFSSSSTNTYLRRFRVKN
jgi:hypothetical protein